EGKRPWIL
nr:xenopsin [Xenopus laevis]